MNVSKGKAKEIKEEQIIEGKVDEKNVSETHVVEVANVEVQKEQSTGAIPKVSVVSETTAPIVDKAAQEIVAKDNVIQDSQYASRDEALRSDKITIRTSEVQGTVESVSLVSVFGQQRVTAVRMDIDEIMIDRQFVLTSKLGGYIQYVPGRRRIEQVNYRLEGPYAHVFESSVLMFDADRSYVMHSLNEKFFTDNSDVKLIGSVPVSNVGLQDYGSVRGHQGMSVYFNGIVGVLARIMSDQTVLYDFEQVRHTTYPLIRFLKTVILKEVGPSMMLAMEKNDVVWLGNYLETFVAAEEEEFVYVFGKIESRYDLSTDVKLVEEFAVNVDQYYATLPSARRTMIPYTQSYTHTQRV